uniref:Fructan hydrolase n=1 Tax=Siphoviridae sp. ctKwY15 TaxID=2827843 RepID=A0A8S5STU3_9CAUD|nr:MAG TPA: hypothetical protein [Siphoviridae sp. ctKwY15]
MAWVAVDKNGSEAIYEEEPVRNSDYDTWLSIRCDVLGRGTDFVLIPKGSIKKLIGRELSWKDEPVELKGD